MQDFHSFRRSAVRYWERRRIIYNAALILPALFGYRSAHVIGVGAGHETTNYAYLLALFVLSGLGANVCYCFSYALEFMFGTDEPTSRWLRYERTVAFVAGLLFAMLLSIIGGWNVAVMEARN